MNSEVDMCSTPKPKKRINGKAARSGSLLSNMSTEARSRFAQRANIAQERRYQIIMKAQQDKRKLDVSVSTVKKVVNRSANLSQSRFSYWLFNASHKEIFFMLFFGVSKRV